MKVTDCFTGEWLKCSCSILDGLSSEDDSRGQLKSNILLELKLTSLKLKPKMEITFVDLSSGLSTSLGKLVSSHSELG